MDLYNKVTRGLTRCIQLISDNKADSECYDCPYLETKECNKAGSPEPMMRDALALIESQSRAISCLQFAADEQFDEIMGEQE